MAAINCDELAQTVADIAFNIGADPKVRGIDDVVKVMQKDFPEIKRADVVNSIVEATTRGPRSRSELDKKLDALKREARRTSEPLIRQRLVKQITEMNQKLVSGDILPAPRPEPVPMTKELERLAFERDRTRKQIDRGIRAMKPQSIFGRVAGGAAEPFNLARSVMTSMDLSAVLRQGGFIALGHPVRAAKSFLPMIRAFASERYAYRVNQEIANRPNAPLYAKSKLYLSETDAGLSKQEESFMSRLAGKIPLVKGSERAYNTFLNKLRADSFDAMTASLSRNGEPTLEESKAIASYVNVATGRGNMGALEQAAVPLNTIFFSPRYVTSRFQLMGGQPLYGGSMATRKLIALDYARFAVGVGVVYALGALAGGEIEKDPRSSDFGKMKFGNTRLDPLTGMSQNSVFLSRVLSGKTKSSTTGAVTPIRGNVPFGKSDALDVGARFVRSKLSPGAGAIVDVATGKDYSGAPVTAKGEALKLITPMAANDMYQAIKSEGVPKGTMMGLFGLLGGGMQTYTKQQKQKEAEPSSAR